MGTLSVDKILKTSTGAAEFTLPATDGTAGQVMQTDGSGQLSVAALAADTVGTAQLSATGTASATTFLRGDNAWTAAALTDWAESGGSLLPSNAAYGIYLGVNTATAANLLSDYEEGTWTPTVNGTATYSTQDGVYTKIGNVVHAVFKLVSSGGAGAGQTITGLPFTASPSDEWAGCLRSSVGITWNGTAPMLNVVGTSIYGVGFNTAASTGQVDFTTFGSSDQLGGFVTYTV
ncbi:uncharacterized protein METZ01_LOCUS218842 [marine metagenome]|uniref:Uncharacterized protein n=1 Tax=marine metagenome TaxID=408172 RepID=A0A382FSC4_9ZZZZ